MKLIAGLFVIGLIAAACATPPTYACTKRKFSVTIDNTIGLLSINGDVKGNLRNRNNWRTASTVPLPCLSWGIHIRAESEIGTHAGILGSTNRGMVTNGNWKCVNASYPNLEGWRGEHYDDSHWPAAHVIGGQGTEKWTPRIPGIAAGAKWIWTKNYRGPNRDKVVYCRRSVPKI